MSKQTLMKGLTACLLVVGFCVAAPRQSNVTQASTQTTSFITKLSPSVQSVANAYKLYPSVMMAQAALESGWGSSNLATQGNNYFGVKGSYNGQSVSVQTAEYDKNGQLYYTNAQFKKYPNIKASMTDNAELLRNGLTSDANFYSGTWRENATTYQDAANALTGKYATAPTYGQTLINLIQTYNMNRLDGDATQPGTNANAKPTTPPTDPQKMAAVTYNAASSSQTATLSSSYNKYAVYNHVKGGQYVAKKISWKTVGGWIGRPVWLDNRAYKPNSKTNWYRIRFSKNTTAKKYWVYSAVLKFPTTKYATASGKVTLAATDNRVYNHVYNSNYLAKTVTTTKSIKSKRVDVLQKATHTQDGITTTWYKIKAGKITGWVKSTALSQSK